MVRFYPDICPASFNFRLGGGYVVPLSNFAASFWNYIRLELGAQGINAGFAIFSYCQYGNGLRTYDS